MGRKVKIERNDLEIMRDFIQWAWLERAKKVMGAKTWSKSEELERARDRLADYFRGAFGGKWNTGFDEAAMTCIEKITEVLGDDYNV